MTPEQRLDRLEKLLRAAIRTGLRERREMRGKINALIDAHIRNEDLMARVEDAQLSIGEALLVAEEAIADLSRENQKLSREQRNLTKAQTALSESQATLAESQAKTDERLSSFISTVERLIKERRNGEP
jgi:FtsZ-binding cell division protein ZapB